MILLIQILAGFLAAALQVLSLSIVGNQRKR
jgi:hypothetical protein